MKRTTLLLLSALLLLAGCHGGKEQLPLSWGHPQTIYVFASDDVWEQTQVSLQRMLERGRYTSQEETWFTLERADITRFNDFYRFDNLLFLGSLDAADETSALMQRTLGKDVVDQVTQRGEGIYSKPEQWAQGQEATFVMAGTTAQLVDFNIRQSEKLFGVFKDALFERIRKHIYLYDVYPPETFANQAFTLDLPNNYVVYKENPADNYICYFLQIGDAPERYLAVWSQKTPRPASMAEWMKAARAHIGADYFAGEKILETGSPRLQKDDFAGHEATRMDGQWINDNYITGGAFQSWGFYDEPTGTAWLVDNSVFYPEGLKLKALVELEIISRTFRLKEVSQ